MWYIVGCRLEWLTLHSSFVLWTVDLSIDVINGQIVCSVCRIGKRIVLVFDEDLDPVHPAAPVLFLVIHLMIVGRLRWWEFGKKLGMGSKLLLVSFVFEHGMLFFIEASSKKRVSLQLVRGEAVLRVLDPGGIELFEATCEVFHEALIRESYTLKRILTDPRLFSGIGNVYSDEILHSAWLSPFKLSCLLIDEEFARLYEAMQATLWRWVVLLCEQVGVGFLEKVIAFHGEMAVHGRFRLSCSVCGALVQCIVYVSNECNYCVVCQTQGCLLVDRALSRLLKDDWFCTLDHC